MNIVIVDDEFKIRRGLINLISERKNWLVVAEFSLAKDALIYLKKNKVDILLTDIKMPGIDGISLISEIRKTDKEVDIIILSGFGEFEYAKRAIEQGVSAFLTKPTDIEELILAIEKIEKKRNGSAKTDNAVIKEVIDFIEKNYNKKLLISEIAKEVFLSPNYLSRLFKEQMNMNIVEFITSVKIKKAKIFLKDIKYSIEQVAQMVGYDNKKYFYVVFKKEVGMTPKEYRNSKNVKI